MRQQQPASGENLVKITCGIHDNGTLFFLDAAGSPLSEYAVEAAKKQNRDAILGLVKRKCDEINGQIEALARLHEDTPDPRTKPRFLAPTYRDPMPAKPKPLELGIWDRLFKSRRKRIEDANRAAERSYQDEVQRYDKEKAAFNVEIAKRKELVEVDIYRDPSAMESFLEGSLQDIAWPRETNLSVEIADGGQKVKLDVDLPELEDMPTKLAAVPARGLKLSVKDLSSTKVHQLYAAHVHGILFRLVGEAFAALPIARTVVASGYSQRREPTTAQLKDDYLLSVKVQRSDWNANDFAHLSALDVVSALARYDLRRDMLKSGLLRTIDPHAD